jgi:methylglyoxal synthase
MESLELEPDLVSWTGNGQFVLHRHKLYRSHAINDQIQKKTTLAATGMNIHQ